MINDYSYSKFPETEPQYPQHKAISEIAEQVSKVVFQYNENELRSIRNIAMKLSPTNCPASNFWVKDVTICFINKRLEQLKYLNPTTHEPKDK